MEKENVDKDLEKMRENLRKMSEELERLKRTTEELSKRVGGGEATERSDLDGIVGEASKLLDVGFSLFGIDIAGRGGAGASGGLAGLIQNLGRLAERSESVRREFEVGGKKGVIDYTIRARPLKPSGERLVPSARRPRRTAGPPRGEATEASALSEEREPMVDIYADEDEITVTADLPGVDEREIEWDVEGETLRIRANAQGRRYEKQVTLPTPVDREGARSSYRNGILEIKLRKRRES